MNAFDSMIAGMILGLVVQIWWKVCIKDGA